MCIHKNLFFSISTLVSSFYSAFSLSEWARLRKSGIISNRMRVREKECCFDGELTGFKDIWVSECRLTVGFHFRTWKMFRNFQPSLQRRLGCSAVDSSDASRDGNRCSHSRNSWYDTKIDILKVNKPSEFWDSTQQQQKFRNVYLFKELSSHFLEDRQREEKVKTLKRFFNKKISLQRLLTCPPLRMRKRKMEKEGKIARSFFALFWWLCLCNSIWRRQHRWEWENFPISKWSKITLICEGEKCIPSMCWENFKCMREFSSVSVTLNTMKTTLISRVFVSQFSQCFLSNNFSFTDEIFFSQQILVDNDATREEKRDFSIFFILSIWKSIGICIRAPPQQKSVLEISIFLCFCLPLSWELNVHNFGLALSPQH